MVWLASKVGVEILDLVDKGFVIREDKICVGYDRPIFFISDMMDLFGVNNIDSKWSRNKALCFIVMTGLKLIYHGIFIQWKSLRVVFKVFGSNGMRLCMWENISDKVVRAR